MSAYGHIRAIGDALVARLTPRGFLARFRRRKDVAALVEALVSTLPVDDVADDDADEEWEERLAALGVFDGEMDATHELGRWSWQLELLSKQGLPSWELAGGEEVGPDLGYGPAKVLSAGALATLWDSIPAGTRSWTVTDWAARAREAFGEEDADEAERMGEEMEALFSYLADAVAARRALFSWNG